jgi:hypothetical protein
MPHKKFQDLNINKSYFCKSDTNTEIEGISTGDLDTKTYLQPNNTLKQEIQTDNLKN